MGPFWVLSAPGGCWPHKPYYQGYVKPIPFVWAIRYLPILLVWLRWVYRLFDSLESYDGDIQYSPKNCAFYLRFIVFSCSFALVTLNPGFQGYFTGTRVMVWCPQYQWLSPDKYGYIHLMNSLINVEPSGAETRILWWNKVNTIHSCWCRGSLCCQVINSHASVEDRLDLVFHEDGFQLPVPSEHW